MRLTHFFIDRPIFATVVSMIITILGVISLRFLPIAEYPEIAPPTVSIRATYPGASAQIIAETVATPIEQEVNGVDDMLYINSQSTGDGQVTINVVFKPGTNVDEAQVLVQNRVAVAEPRLPEDVRRLGISVRKASPDLMMVVHMVSPDGSRESAVHFELRDALRQRRADAHRRRRRRDRVRRARLLDAYLARPGQGGGARLDRRRGRRSVAGLQSAGRGRFDQSAASNVGRRLHAQRQDARAADLAGPVRRYRRARRAGWPSVRVRDIARVELGAQDYTVNAYLDNKNATALVIFQKPGSNALATAAAVKAQMETLKKDFPPGLGYTVVYNPTEFIQASIDAVVRTLAEAILLVVLVVILFLQTWRAAIIPILAIPVSLIGTFFVMNARRHHVQHAVAVWLGPRDRHRRRRRDRRRRECRALHRARAKSQGSRPQDDGRSRNRADRDLPRSHRRVPADRLHHRIAGNVLQTVRDYDRSLHRHFVDRIVDAFAGNGGTLAEAASA